MGDMNRIQIKQIALIVAILLFSVNLNAPIPSKHGCGNKYGYGMIVIFCRN